MSRSDTLLFIGNSRTPENCTVHGSNKVVGLVLEIERETGEIVNVETTLITQLARDFIYKILINQNINDVDNLSEKIQDRFLASTKRSIIKCLFLCHNRYKLVQSGVFPSDDEMLSQ